MKMTEYLQLPTDERTSARQAAEARTEPLLAALRRTYADLHTAEAVALIRAAFPTATRMTLKFDDDVVDLNRPSISIEDIYDAAGDCLFNLYASPDFDDYSTACDWLSRAAEEGGAGYFKEIEYRTYDQFIADNGSHYLDIAAENGSHYLDIAAFLATEHTSEPGAASVLADAVNRIRHRYPDATHIYISHPDDGRDETRVVLSGITAGDASLWPDPLQFAELVDINVLLTEVYRTAGSTLFEPGELGGGWYLTLNTADEPAVEDTADRAARFLNALNLRTYPPGDDNTYTDDKAVVDLHGVSISVYPIAGGLVVHLNTDETPATYGPLHVEVDEDDAGTFWAPHRAYRRHKDHTTREGRSA